jgi:hypothetical protein
MKKINTSFVFLVLVFTLVLESILKYIGVEWIANEYGTLASMGGNSLGRIKVLCFVELIILVIGCFPIKKNKLTFCALLMILFGVFWSTYSFHGMAFFYWADSPLLLLQTGIIYIVAQNYKVQYWFEKTCGLLAILYTVLAFYNGVYFVTYYSGMRMADGIVIEYFYTALFLTAIWNSVMDRTRKNVILVCLMSVIIFICAIITSSRGWIFQASILVVFCYFTSSNRKASFKIITLCIFFLAIFAIYATLINFFDSALFLVISRVNEDTRFGQYTMFFEQVPIRKLITGAGADASYDFAGVTDYKYIDNLFLYLLFHYGLVPTLLYLYPYVKALFIQRNSIELSWWKKNCAVLMWLAAMMGVSIYCSLKLDIAQLYLSIVSIRFSLRHYDQGKVLSNAN